MQKKNLQTVNICISIASNFHTLSLCFIHSPKHVVKLKEDSIPYA